MKITSSVFSDKFELCNAKGELVKEIPFTVNITSVAALVTQKQHALADVDQNDVAAMGKEFIELLTAIFGEQVTSELLDYYAEDYLVMITDLAPMLTENIFPVFDNYRKSIIDAKKKVKK